MQQAVPALMCLPHTSALHLAHQLRTLSVCSACVSAFSCSACSSMAAFRPASAWTSRASPAGTFSCCSASRVAYSAEPHSETLVFKAHTEA